MQARTENPLHDPHDRSRPLDRQEVIRIAVRSSLATVGAMLALIMALYLFAAAASPSINVPGIRLHSSGHAGPPSGD